MKCEQEGYTPSNRYALGTGGILSQGEDGVAYSIVEAIRKELPNLDLTRKFVVYVRKSNPAAETAKGNYLAYQEHLHLYLEEAGVGKEQIEVFSEDVGISAVYDEKYRPSLKKIDNWLLNPDIIGTIVVVDISRIYRDPTMVGPSLLASKLKTNRVKILTFDGGSPNVMDMRNQGHYDNFIQRCMKAANHRHELRTLTTRAREQAFESGFWSGSPLPVGWALTLPTTETRLGRRVEVGAKVVMYEPHAKIKMQIMRLADDPKIKTYKQLLLAVQVAGIVIPPFEDSLLRNYMQSRSCLKNCGTRNPDGTILRHDADTDKVPTKTMLVNLLLDPLALGYRMYGSGVESGGRELRALTRKYANMGGKTHDSLIRDYREFGNVDPDLAICKTEEEEALYWRLLHKWSQYDADVLRDSNFTSYSKNKERVKLPRGRPAGESLSNGWVGLLYCMRHGYDETGDANRTHLMTYNAGKRAERIRDTARWECNKDNRDTYCSPCIRIGGNDRLTRVLDDFFRRRVLSVVIRIQHEYHDNGDIVLSLEAQLDDLTRQHDRKQKDVNRQNKMLMAKIVSWEEDDACTPDEVDAETVRYQREWIKPEEDALRQITRSIKDLEHQIATAIPAQVDMKNVAGLVQQMTRQNLWHMLTPAMWRDILLCLVESVEVWADTEPVIDDVYVSVKWKCGLEDTLITWRNPPLDRRPFSHEEDEALQALWASNCTVEELRAQLQPGRRYLLVRRHVQQDLKVNNANRSREWREHFDFLGKSYHQRHPDALYFMSDGDSWQEISEANEDIARHAGLPHDVVNNLRRRDCVIGTKLTVATSIRDKRPDLPP